MWGLFVLAAMGIGAMVVSCKNDAENLNCRNEAKDNERKYYVDNLGKWRSVDNNHQVAIRSCGGRKHNWDEVDVDMKTGTVLRNHTQEKRNEITNKKNEIRLKNEEAKQVAIKDGKYFYIANEPPIERYEGSSIEYYYYQKELGGLTPIENLSYYEDHKRRVEDDLLLEKDTVFWRPIREFKTRLIVCDIEAEKKNDIEKINQHREWNRRQCRCSFIQKDCNMTEYELIEHAKKIGAYM